MVGRVSDSSLERRKSPRVVVSLAVELRDARGFSLHSSRDISIGGLFFDRAIPHAIGERLTVVFKLPGDDRSIICPGQVANVPDETSFGMGVRFVDMNPTDRDRLQKFIDAEGSLE